MQTSRYRLLQIYGRAATLSLLSQGLSALAIIQIALKDTSLSDHYAQGLVTGTASFNGLVIGIFYLIAVGRPDFKEWDKAKYLVLTGSIVITIISIALDGQARSQDVSNATNEFWVTLIFGVGGGFLAMAGVEGVRAACLGIPRPLITVALWANAALAGAALLLLVISQTDTPLDLLPALAWSAANIANWFQISKASKTLHYEQLTATTTGAPKGSRLQILGLVIGGGVSAVSPLAYLRAVGQIGGGSASAIFLISRVGAAFINTTINAALTAKYNWSKKHENIGIIPSLCVLLSSIAGLAALISHHQYRVDTHVSYGFVLAAWLFSSIGPPFLVREVNHRALGGTVFLKSFADAICTTLMVLFLFVHPSIAGFFAATSFSQSLSCFINSLSMRQYTVASSSFFALCVFLAALLFGW